MSYQRLEKGAFTELLAEYFAERPERSAWQEMQTVAAVLSVGGGVALYATVPRPQEPHVPTNRGAYSIGYTRAVPPPNRLGIHVDHRHDVFTGERAEENTHAVAHYRGEPIYYAEDITSVLNRHPEFAGQSMREQWFLDAYGPLPPVEIFQRGLTRLDAKRYPDYLYGPGYTILCKTECRHHYHLTDSCPGCDADEEGRTGPWEGVVELDYV